MLQCYDNICSLQPQLMGPPKSMGSGVIVPPSRRPCSKQTFYVVRIIIKVVISITDNLESFYAVKMTIFPKNIKKRPAAEIFVPKPPSLGRKQILALG